MSKLFVEIVGEKKLIVSVTGVAEEETYLQIFARAVASEGSLAGRAILKATAVSVNKSELVMDAEDTLQDATDVLDGRIKILKLELNAAPSRAATAPVEPEAAPTPVPAVSELLAVQGEEQRNMLASATSEHLAELVRDLIYGAGRELALELLRCVYTAYFPPYPHSARARDLWFRAFTEREKIASARNPKDIDSLHDSANALVCQALKEEAWLPFRYTCLWNYNGKFPLILDRMEYDATHDILSLLETRTLAEDDLLAAVSRCRDQSARENQHRLSVVPGYTRDTSSCCRGDRKSCFIVPGRGDRCLCSPGHKGQYWMEKHENRILRKDLESIDPGDLFSQVIANWPANPVGQDNKSPFFTNLSIKGCSSSTLYFSVSRLSRHVKEFDAVPPEFKKALESMTGSQSGQSSTKLYDISMVFEELHVARTQRIGHHHETDIDLGSAWHTMSSVIMATYVVQQQARDWKVGGCGKSGFPTERAVASLLTTCATRLENLFSTMRSMTPGSVPIHATGDQFEKFLTVTNNLEPGGPLLVLILPPLAEHLIPGYLAVAPWNLIIDFSNANTCSRTGSPGWRRLSEALSGNQIKGHHIKLDERRIFGPNTEVNTIGKMLSNDRCGVPWVMPYTTSQGALFDARGCTVNEDAEIRKELILQQLNDLATVVASSQNQRVLQLVMPMYGSYSVPLEEHGNWYFKTSFAIDSTELDFAFPYFLRVLLNRFSFNCKLLKACVMLNTEATAVTERGNAFYKRDCLRRDVNVEYIHLKPEFFQMRYRMHRANVSVKIRDVISVKDSQGSFVPLIRGDPETDFDDIDTRQESYDNLRILQDCGIDLLHSESGPQSLDEFANSALLSAFKSGPRNVANVSPHVIAVLNFCFSYPPSWALFSDEVMAEGDITLPKEVVVKRDYPKKFAPAAYRLWSSGFSAVINVKHTPRAGATTLMRSFAWETANGLGPNKWSTTVIWIKENFNHTNKELLENAARTIGECTMKDHPIVLFADRNISSLAITRFYDCLSDCDVKVLLIRIQHDTDTENIESLFPGTKSESVHIGLPHDEDEKKVTRMMFGVAKYFDPNLDVVRISNLQQLISQFDGKFKKIMFMGVIDFCTKRGESGKQSVTREQLENRKWYYSILESWVEQVMDVIFPQVLNKEKNDGMPYSRISAIRALSYLAIVQLCCSDGTSLDIDSFRLVFDDPSSSRWLFEHWKSSNIEDDLLLKSHQRMRDQKLSTPSLGDRQAWGALLPFIDDELIANAPAVSGAGATALSAANFPRLDEANSGFDVAETVGPGTALRYSSVLGAGDGNTDGSRDPVGDASPRTNSFELVEKYVNLRDNARSSLRKRTGDSGETHPARMFSGAAVNGESLQKLFSILLSAPPEHTANKAVSPTDRLEDVENLLWSELLLIKDGRIRFVTDDIAKVFLQVVLRKEYEKAPIFGPSESAMSPMHYYVLVMSLLATLQKDQATVDNLDVLSSYDICNLQDSFGENFSLSWIAQRVFNEGQEKFPAERTGLKKDFKKWSWALVHMYSGSSTEHSRTELGDAFGNTTIKVLLAAQCVYFGYWRISSTLTRLMQFNSTVYQNYLRGQRDQVRSDPTANMTNLLADADTIFLSGVKLFLASTGQMLTAIRETGHKDDDRKKVSGSFAMIGNSVKSFLNIVKTVAQVKSDFETGSMDFLVNSTMTMLLALGNIARYFYKQSLHIFPHAVAHADELDCWLSILEAEKVLRSLTSSSRPINPNDNDVNSMILLLWGQEIGNFTDFDNFIGNSKPASRIFDVDTALDTCHDKLVELNLANMNDSEVKGTRFDQNWDREETYMWRLWKLEDTNSFKSWSDEFNVRCIELDKCNDHSVVPYIRKRLAHFGMFMWQFDTSKSQEKDKDKDKTSVKFHETMLDASEKRSNTSSDRDQIITVISCTVECMDKLQVKFPHRLMSGLMETVPYLRRHHILHTPVKYCPYSLGRLLPTMKEWMDSAKHNYQRGVIDEISYATALRFQAIFTFLSVWAKTTLVPGGQEDPFEAISQFHECNGYTDGDAFKPGTLEAKFRNFVHYHERYVMPKYDPTLYEGIKYEEDESPLNICPFLLRRQFSIIQTGQYENNQGFQMQLLFGTVIRLNAHKKDSTQGVVELRNSTLQLPFRYDHSVLHKLNAEKLGPVLHQPCSFYVNFLPWKVEAYAVQFHGEKERVPLKKMYVTEELWHKIESNVRRDNPPPRDRSEENPRLESEVASSIIENEDSAVTRVVDSSGSSIATVAEQLAVSEKLSSMNFSDLRRFDASDGIPVRLLLMREFLKSDVPKIQQGIYGFVNYNEKTSKQSFSTPYQGVDENPSDSCGYIAVPARIIERLTPAGPQHKKETILFALIWEDIFCKWDYSHTTSVNKLGRAKGSEKIEPKKLSNTTILLLNRDTVEGMFILLSLPSWGLAAVAEGLLAIKRREGTAHFDLGVIFFRNTKDSDACDAIKDIWNQSKQAFIDTNWNYLAKVREKKQPQIFLASETDLNIPVPTARLAAIGSDRTSGSGLDSSEADRKPASFGAALWDFPALSSPQKDSAAVASSNWHPLGEARVPVRSEAIAYGGPLISTSTAQNSLWQQARGPSFSSGHVNGESVIPTGVAPTLGPCPGFEANAKPSTAERWTTNVKKPANNQHHVATTSAGSRPEKSMVACVHHFHCTNGLSCDYKHTPEEEKIFKTFPGGTYKLRTNECNTRSVKHDKVKCPYFHLTPNSRGKVSRDVICLNCHLVGHFPENCPSPSRKNR